MYLQGAILEGARYGGITPLDFSGLDRWHKSTNGVSLLGSNIVNRWDDLSTTTKDLTPFFFSSISATTENVYGSLAPTQWGLGLKGSSGDRWLGSSGVDYKYQYDGSPFTAIFVYRSSPANIGVALSNGPQNAGSRFGFSHNTGGGNNIVARIVGMPNLDTAANTTSANTNYIVVVNNYGYGSTSPNATISVNGNILQQRDYTSAPPTAANNAPVWGIRNDGFSFMYETIFYNQTGKSRQQINDEVSQLTTGYISLQYQNFI